MKRLIFLFTTMILFLGLISCNRFKNKTEKLTSDVKKKTKDGIKKQSRKVLDKVFPPFDSDKPDTENNRKRFLDFLKVELTCDIKNIYCFDDSIGIDSDYMFAFNCNSETSQKIIELHNLKIDSLDLNNAFGLQHDFEWWNKKRIKQLRKYSWTDNNDYFKYYWYDKENQKAYFFDFDL